MTTHRLWKRTTDTVHVAVVIAVIMALGLSGAMAAERAYVETSRARAAAAVEEAKLLPQPAEAAAAQGSMAKGSGPCSEQAALHAAPIGVTSNNETRFRGVDIVSPQLFAAEIVPVNVYTPRQSSALVSTRLALQFTLVGAKPSGTM